MLHCLVFFSKELLHKKGLPHGILDGMSTVIVSWHYCHLLTAVQRGVMQD